MPDADTLHEPRLHGSLSPPCPTLALHATGGRPYTSGLWLDGVPGMSRPDDIQYRKHTASHAEYLSKKRAVDGVVPKGTLFIMAGISGEEVGGWGTSGLNPWSHALC